MDLRQIESASVKALGAQYLMDAKVKEFEACLIRGDQGAADVCRAQACGALEAMLDFKAEAVRAMKAR